MTRWTTLRDDIEKSRLSKKDWRNAMIVEVKRMAEHGICNYMAPYWISQDRSLVGILRGGDAQIGAYRAIGLQQLPCLDSAKLSFSIVVNRDTIVEYTVSVVGVERNTSRGWYARIDLDPEQRGQGPCCHPILHCHVGVDPSEEDHQESRVPLPWLDPDHALAWILATLVPDHFEPQ